MTAEDYSSATQPKLIINFFSWFIKSKMEVSSVIYLFISMEKIQQSVSSLSDGKF